MKYIDCHTFRFSYYPYRIPDDENPYSQSISMPNAELVYAELHVSDSLMQLLFNTPNHAKEVLKSELKEELNDFVDEVLRVNQQRLESK